MHITHSQFGYTLHKDDGSTESIYPPYSAIIDAEASTYKIEVSTKYMNYRPMELRLTAKPMASFADTFLPPNIAAPVKPPIEAPAPKIEPPKIEPPKIEPPKIIPLPVVGQHMERREAKPNKTIDIGHHRTPKVWPPALNWIINGEVVPAGPTQMSQMAEAWRMIFAADPQNPPLIHDYCKRHNRPGRFWISNNPYDCGAQGVKPIPDFDGWWFGGLWVQDEKRGNIVKACRVAGVRFEEAPRGGPEEFSPDGPPTVIWLIDGHPIDPGQTQAQQLGNAWAMLASLDSSNLNTIHGYSANGSRPWVSKNRSQLAKDYEAHSRAIPNHDGWWFSDFHSQSMKQKIIGVACKVIGVPFEARPLTDAPPVEKPSIEQLENLAAKYNGGLNEPQGIKTETTVEQRVNAKWRPDWKI